jgi:hypothetical protein
MFNLTDINPADKLLSLEEGAALCGVSIATILRSGMPRYHQGRRRFFHSDDVVALARCRSRRMQPTVWPSEATAVA